MIALLVIIAILVLLFFVSLFVIYRMVFGRTKEEKAPTYVPGLPQYQVYKEETIEMVNALVAEKYEEVSIISFDGLSLMGRLYRRDEKKPVAILFHGYHGGAYRDFCGGSRIFLSMDWNVILVDQRAHGRSEGKTISFGINERFDVVDWTRKAREIFPESDIFVVGISMGGASVLMASSLLDKKDVKAIIADCPFSSPEKIISKVMRDRKLNPFFLLPLVKLSARIFGHFSLTATTAKDEVGESDIPIMIIHGLEDHFVPDYMSREVYEANLDKVRYETFPGAGHGLSYMVDKDRYWRVSKEFLLSHTEG